MQLNLTKLSLFIIPTFNFGILYFVNRNVVVFLILLFFPASLKQPKWQNGREFILI